MVKVHGSSFTNFTLGESIYDFSRLIDPVNNYTPSKKTLKIDVRSIDPDVEIDNRTTMLHVCIYCETCGVVLTITVCL